MDVATTDPVIDMADLSVQLPLILLHGSRVTT